MFFKEGVFYAKDNFYIKLWNALQTINRFYLFVIFIIFKKIINGSFQSS